MYEIQLQESDLIPRGRFDFANSKDIALQHPFRDLVDLFKDIRQLLKPRGDWNVKHCADCCSNSMRFYTNSHQPTMKIGPSLSGL